MEATLTNLCHPFQFNSSLENFKMIWLKKT